MLSFKTLWENHPYRLGEPSPCRTKQGDPAFVDQCAIRLGVTLKSSGMKTASFQGARCWFGHGHMLRVADVVTWLKFQSHYVGKATKYNSGADAADAVAGRTGIVACLDFGGSNHIDLWDGNAMGKGDPRWITLSETAYFWPIA